jgi:CheY-like chemotaxis protein
VALRQMLINLLTDALQTAPGAAIRLAARARPGHIEIGVQSAGAPSGANATNMETTRRLATLSGGALALGPETKPFAVTLTLPALEPITVLVVDDNADALELLKRYASGTRYRLIATRDPERVIALAEQHAPRVILLDIMMPQVDGWQVLASLRQRPAASQTRILVCTILAQEALALSLGANGLLRKPITRQTFLAALDAQVAPRE